MLVSVVTESYQRVIDILTSSDVNYKAIALAVAKDSPEMFVAAYESLSPDNPGEEPKASPEIAVLRELQRQIRLDSTRVKAIKDIRQHFFLGLKDAKDICDIVRTYFNGGGDGFDGGYLYPSDMSAGNRHICQMIINAV